MLQGPKHCHCATVHHPERLIDECSGGSCSKMQTDSGRFALSRLNCAFNREQKIKPEAVAVSAACITLPPSPPSLPSFLPHPKKGQIAANSSSCRATGASWGHGTETSRVKPSRSSFAKRQERDLAPQLHPNHTHTELSSSTRFHSYHPAPSGPCPGGEDEATNSSESAGPSGRLRFVCLPACLPALLAVCLSGPLSVCLYVCTNVCVHAMCPKHSRAREELLGYFQKRGCTET